MKTLLDMLSYRRPDKSGSENAFIERFLIPLGVTFDRYGNAILEIGDSPSVLWSCHTDTVHKKGGKQKLDVDTFGLISLAENEKSNCLGADDGAGVWLMCEMILAKKPGLYIFHANEEHGGCGSEYIASETPELLKGIKYAIAFDRRGVTDVITHQAFERCCSDLFARGLADRLNILMAQQGQTAQLAPCAEGVFTDTANYTKLVPECTNISVGYYCEHTKNENLNSRYLMRLRDALIALDLEGLPVARDLTVSEWDSFGAYGKYDFGQPYGSAPRAQAQELAWGVEYSQELSDDVMVSLIKANPEEVAALLLSYGISARDLADEIFAQGGNVNAAL